jgi:hypothetical protein
MCEFFYINITQLPMPTKDPLRKLMKKQRQAHAKGNGQLSLDLQGEINHFHKCLEVNEKKKIKKEIMKKRGTMTDDEIFEEALKWNMENHRDKENRLDMEKKKDDMEKKKSRTKKKRQITLQVQKIREEDRLASLQAEHDMSVKHNKAFMKRVKYHEKKVKSREPDELRDSDELREPETEMVIKGNPKKKGVHKKKVKKIQNRILENKGLLIEMTIQGYMDEHKVSYKDARTKIYEFMNEPPSTDTKEVEPWIEEIEDNVAKL